MHVESPIVDVVILDDDVADEVVIVGFTFPSKSPAKLTNVESMRYFPAPVTEKLASDI